MRSILADLHIHTALSPCADGEMTPPAIVHEAVMKGLGMIAICDHNSAANTEAVQKAAGGLLTVIAGMEITTAEEVHVIGLFPTVQSAAGASDLVGAALPDMDEGSPRHQRQLVMDADGAPLRLETKALYGSTTFTLGQTVALIRRFDGLVIAAHVDKPGFSVPGQLGIFPEDVVFDAFEVSIGGVRSRRYERFLPPGATVITSSDGHYLCDVGSSCTVLELLGPSFEELAAALAGAGERRCRFA